MVRFVFYSRRSLLFYTVIRTVESYDWTKLDAFSLEDKRRFVLSAAGSFVAAFILGVRDRHRDKDICLH